MNIILIGYRGSGKTTVGRLLADQLKKTFVDVDDEICGRFGGRTIADIWERDGERAYRDVECQVAADLCSRDEHIIGLGGGTLGESPARRSIEEADAVRIYLKCDSQTLLQRISADVHSAATRPNLTRLGGGIEEIETMLAQRQPVYEAVADVILEVSRMTPEQVAEMLVRNHL